MATGNIESFTGNMAEIGPLYPFIGMEFILFVLAFVFWIAWHVWQFKMEKREYQAEMDKYVNKEVLQRVLKREEKDSGI